MLKTYKLPLNCEDTIIDSSDIYRKMNKWLVCWGSYGVLTADVFLDDKSYNDILTSRELDPRLRYENNCISCIYNHFVLSIHYGAKSSYILTTISDRCPPNPYTKEAWQKEMLDRFAQFELN
jgi:hypothetical protein